MFLTFPFTVGIFPEKIARVASISKEGNEWDISNYRSLSSCFRKILEKTTYNRVYKHVNKSNLLYKIMVFRRLFCSFY